MGSPPAEVARDTDEIQHRVTLTHDFLLMDTEVVQSDFQKLMGYNPSDFTSCGGSCPVENVNWHEAAAYSNALSRLERLAECYACTGQGAGIICEPSEDFVKPYQCTGYRLPTEAEWEYAARAGTTTATYGGDLDPAHLACEMPNLTLDRISWFCGNSGNAPHQVKTRAANAWSIYDMLGNVYEWCHDWYQEYRSGGRTDPWGQPRGTESIVRGGSWCCRHNRDVRAAERMSEPPVERHSAMGFRVARTLP
jgi:formylglycine-generating enzyme required for sulfatase activity